ARILSSGENASAELLFKTLMRGRLSRAYLTDAIKMCGDMKIKESYGFLRSIFMRRPFFYNKFTDLARVASVVSLAQLGTPESMAIVKGATSDPSDAVRRMSGIILELDKADKAGGEAK
nr:hypothetical protein [Candidatus Omnitrophota bacterium]